MFYSNVGCVLVCWWVDATLYCLLGLSGLIDMSQFFNYENFVLNFQKVSQSCMFYVFYSHTKLPITNNTKNAPSLLPLLICPLSICSEYIVVPHMLETRALDFIPNDISLECLKEESLADFDV